MRQEVLPNFSLLAKSLVIGSLYEHYKGLRYKILNVALHSETLEEMVVYQSLYGDNNVWVRPLAMFLEHVTVDSKIQPRFKPVENE